MTDSEILSDIQQRLIRIETVLLGVPDSSNTGLFGQVERNTRRLNVLEKWQAGVIAIAGFVAVIISVGLAFINKWGRG